MKFSGKTWLNIKSHKKTRLHPLSRIYKFGTSYNYCKNLKWKKPFQDFGFFDFWYRVKFLSLLNIKLQQLSKHQVKECFPRYPSFLFWGTGHNWRLTNFENVIFSFKCISWRLSLCLSRFFVIFTTEVTTTVKVRSEGTLSEISEFSILGIGQN